MGAKKNSANKQPQPGLESDSFKTQLRRFVPILPILLVGFIGGFLWLSGLRFFLLSSDVTHYHANFVVNIDGIREEFKDFTYYEEVAACTGAYANDPKGRVHMHDKVNDVIHVHDKRVTYGNFFQNIGWNVGDEFIASRDTVFQTDDSNKVVYILNGEEVENIATRVIGNEDHLLVSYGPDMTDFQAQFEQVPTTAAEVNSKPDPASCAGSGGGTEDFMGRVKRATFWQ